MPPDPYTPYPPSSYGAPGSGPYAGPPHDDSLSWAGIGCSVASWLTCCCMPVPFIGMIVGLGGLLLAALGIVCGVLAQRAATRNGGRTDLAIIAIVVGALRLLITVGFIGVVIVLVGTVGLAGYFQQAGH